MRKLKKTRWHQSCSKVNERRWRFSSRYYKFVLIFVESCRCVVSNCCQLIENVCQKKAQKGQKLEMSSVSTTKPTWHISCYALNILQNPQEASPSLRPKPTLSFLQAWLSFQFYVIPCFSVWKIWIEPNFQIDPNTHMLIIILHNTAFKCYSIVVFHQSEVSQLTFLHFAHYHEVESDVIWG